MRHQHTCHERSQSNISTADESHNDTSAVTGGMSRKFSRDASIFDAVCFSISTASKRGKLPYKSGITTIPLMHILNSTVPILALLSELLRETKRKEDVTVKWAHQITQVQSTKMAWLLKK